MREIDLHDGGAELFEGVERGSDGVLHGGVIGVRQILPGDADAQAGDGLVHLAEVVGHGDLGGGGVQRIMAGHDLHDQGGVFHSVGKGADLVEAGGEGDKSVAGDEAVGGLVADDATQGCGLADGAACVGTEGADAEVSGHGGGSAAGGATGDAGDVPGVFGGAAGRVFSAGAHGEFIEVGFTQDDGACGLQTGDSGGVVRSLEVGEDLGRACGVTVVGAHVVFDGDGHAGQRAGDLAGINLRGTGKRTLVIGFVIGAELRVKTVDPVQAGLDRNSGGDLLGGDGVAEGNERCLGDVHGSLRKVKREKVQGKRQRKSREA